MSAKTKPVSVRVQLLSLWGDVVFSAETIEGFREDMEEVFRLRADALSAEEQAYHATQGPAAWVGERMRKALVAGDGCWNDSELLTLADIEQEILARSEWSENWPRHLYFSGAIEDALLDGLLAALQLQAEGLPLSTGHALVWRFCYRLSQVSALVADAAQDDLRRSGKRGGPEKRGNVGEAKRLAIRYLQQHAFDADGKIRPQKVLELEVWEMLFARRGEPGAFQIAGSPGRPTDRAIKTVRSFIATDYGHMCSGLLNPDTHLR